MSADNDRRYAVTGSSVEFRGRVMTVRVDDVVMPGGGSAKREIVVHDRAVAVVALDLPELTDVLDAGDPDVVLIEQYRHPLRRKLWELPAGLMDVPGEEALAAARRELAEETGLAARSWHVLVDSAPSPGYCDEVIRIFLATGLSEVGRSEMVNEEADLRIVRIPLSVALAAVADGRIVNGSAVAGLLAADRALVRPEALRDPSSPWGAGAGDALHPPLSAAGADSADRADGAAPAPKDVSAPELAPEAQVPAGR